MRTSEWVTIKLFQPQINKSEKFNSVHEGYVNGTETEEIIAAYCINKCHFCSTELWLNIAMDLWDTLG